MSELPFILRVWWRTLFRGCWKFPTYQSSFIIRDHPLLVPYLDPLTMMNLSQLRAPQIRLRPTSLVHCLFTRSVTQTNWPSNLHSHIRPGDKLTQLEVDWTAALWLQGRLDRLRQIYLFIYLLLPDGSGLYFFLFRMSSSSSSSSSPLSSSSSCLQSTIILCTHWYFTPTATSGLFKRSSESNPSQNPNTHLSIFFLAVAFSRWFPSSPSNYHLLWPFSFTFNFNLWSAEMGEFTIYSRIFFILMTIYTSKTSQMSSSLIGCPIHTTLCHI